MVNSSRGPGPSVQPLSTALRPREAGGAPGQRGLPVHLETRAARAPGPPPALPSPTHPLGLQASGFVGRAGPHLSGFYLAHYSF